MTVLHDCLIISNRDLSGVLWPPLKPGGYRQLLVKVMVAPQPLMFSAHLLTESDEGLRVDNCPLPFPVSQVEPPLGPVFYQALLASPQSEGG